MDDSLRMAVIHSTDKLVHKHFDLIFSQRVLSKGEVFFQIKVCVLKHQVQLIGFHFVDNVFKAELNSKLLNNIWMGGELSEDGNLSQGSGGDSFISTFKLYVFDSDDFS